MSISPRSRPSVPLPGQKKKIIKDPTTTTFTTPFPIRVFQQYLKHLGKIPLQSEKRLICNRHTFSERRPVEVGWVLGGWGVTAWPCKTFAHQFLFPSELCNCQFFFKGTGFSCVIVRSSRVVFSSRLRTTASPRDFRAVVPRSQTSTLRGKQAGDLQAVRVQRSSQEESCQLGLVPHFFQESLRT